MIMEALSMANTFKTEAASVVVGLLMGAGLVAVNDQQTLTDGWVQDHTVEFVQLKGSVEAVGKDVSYNRERGDIIQKTNTDDHAGLEKQIDALSAESRANNTALNLKLDRIIERLP